MTTTVASAIAVDIKTRMLNSPNLGSYLCKPMLKLKICLLSVGAL